MRTRVQIPSITSKLGRVAWVCKPSAEEVEASRSLELTDKLASLMNELPDQ